MSGHIVMVMEIMLKGKTASKKLSDDRNGNNTLKLPSVPIFRPLALVNELNSFVDMEKLPVGILAFLSTKFVCLERTVQRYHSKVRHAY